MAALLSANISLYSVEVGGNVRFLLGFYEESSKDYSNDFSGSLVKRTASVTRLNQSRERHKSLRRQADDANLNKVVSILVSYICMKLVLIV